MFDLLIRGGTVATASDVFQADVAVKDGVIAKIDAALDSGNPVTNDFICSKVRHFAKRVYHEDRLLHPMHRVAPREVVRLRLSRGTTRSRRSHRTLVLSGTSMAVKPSCPTTMAARTAS